MIIRNHSHPQIRNDRILVGDCSNPGLDMFAFLAPMVPQCFPVSNSQKRYGLCGRRIVRACANESMYTPQYRKWSPGEVCSYCENDRVVTCPVCHGEGVLGRTIVCRYCRGKKKLDCPLCSVDDVYQLSFGANDSEEMENNRKGEEEVSDANAQASTDDSY